MNDDLPSLAAIRALHEKYAPSREALALVLTHCEIVRDIAWQLMDKTPLDVDARLVEAGCLLHDIGVYRLYMDNGEIDHANYIKHGVLGYDLLKSEGFSERMCRIASCHTGVGLSREDVMRDGLPIPPRDYFASTREEQLIMYADKFHSKTTPPTFLTTESYEEKIRKFGDDKIRRFRELREEFGVPDLRPLREKFGYEIV